MSKIEALKELKHWKETNNENGVVWLPLFAVENIEEALEELEQIKETKPSEAMKCLHTIAFNLSFIIGVNFENEIETIKQALLKAQEQEKVLNVIKGKIIWNENDKLMCGRYADTEIELEEEDFENKEEFNTLRGMLDD